jgi:hypothetical protein
MWVPADGEAIREAILARMPEDDNVTRDIKMYDGLVDIAIRWRTLRFSTTISAQNLSADDIAEIVAREFKTWLLKILYVDPDPDRQKVNPKAATVIEAMRVWAHNQGYTQ